MASDTPILPAHIEDTVQSIAGLHAEHYQQATRLQRIVDRMTALIGCPRTLKLFSTQSRTAMKR